MHTAATVEQIPDTLVITYLHMQHRRAFRPAYVQRPDVQIKRMEKPDVNFYRFLYRSVGERWRWRDRLLLSDAELLLALSAPGCSVHVMYVKNEPAGYIELVREHDTTEVAYFGIRAEFFGQGLGKHLLSYGLEQAWKENNTRRVWVHTCNLDGPAALDNYIKRGFSVYDVHEKPMPERYI